MRLRGVAIPFLSGLLCFKETRKLETSPQSQSLFYQVFFVSSARLQGNERTKSRNPFFIRSSLFQYNRNIDIRWRSRNPFFIRSSLFRMGSEGRASSGVAIPFLSGLLCFPLTPFKYITSTVAIPFLSGLLCFGVCTQNPLAG